MLVVPYPVGPDPLFIDEKLALADMGDLREPTGPNPRHNPQAVLDDLSCVHSRRDVAHDAKPQVRRGEEVEVAGRGEELPDRGRVARHELLSVQVKDHGMIRAAPSRGCPGVNSDPGEAEPC